MNCYVYKGIHSLIRIINSIQIYFKLDIRANIYYLCNMHGCRRLMFKVRACKCTKQLSEQILLNIVVENIISTKII